MENIQYQFATPNHFAFILIIGALFESRLATKKLIAALMIKYWISISRNNSR